MANSADPDQMPRSVASDQGLHCLPRPVCPKTIRVNMVFQVRTFCFCVGFTVAFGAMFSKTWRVYKIFTNKKLLKMVSKSKHEWRHGKKSCLRGNANSKGPDQPAKIYIV